MGGLDRAVSAERRNVDRGNDLTCFAVRDGEDPLGICGAAFARSSEIFRQTLFAARNA